MTLKVATFNINQGGVFKIPSLLPLFDELKVDVFAFQEVNIPFESRISWISRWKALGFHAVLCSAAEGTSAVALVSRFPCKEIIAAEVVDQNRFAAAMFEFAIGSAPNNRQFRKLLIANVYAHVTNTVVRDALVHEAVAFLEQSAHPWILLGDFNMTDTEGAVNELVNKGAAASLDEPFALLPETTRPAGHRRLDFGLSSHGIFPVERCQTASFSDHDIVSYSFPGWGQPSGFVFPRRIPFGDKDRPKIRSFSADLHAFSQFQNSLFLHDCDAAWTVLSDWAESQLQDVERSVRSFCRRSQPWRPQQVAAVNKGATTGYEPFALRRLRRLHRRLIELTRCPLHEALRRKVQIGLEKASLSFPSLAQVDSFNPGAALKIVESEVNEFADQMRSQALMDWKARMAQDSSAQVRWVQHRANSEVEMQHRRAHHAEDVARLQAAIHPSAVIQQAEVEWSNVWDAPGAEADSVFHHLLRCIPQPGVASEFLGFSGSNLLAACRQMTSKAAGPDQWEAKDLLHLPFCWWDALASLWQTVLDTGRIPARWCEARIVFIPKKNGGTRPLSLTSMLWRIGAKVLTFQLREWVRGWINPRTFGGIPDRSVIDAHLHLLKAIDDVGDEAVFVSEDLCKFFDSVSWTQAFAILDKLQAPPAWTRLVAQLYAGSRRIFSAGGMLGSQWKTAQRGLLQGCPFSPLIAAAVMAVWSYHVCREDHIEACVYLDDRTFWLCPGAPTEALLAAKQRSAEFDRICGFVCRQDKCHVATKSHEFAMSCNAHTFGYDMSSKLEILGLVHDLDKPRNPTLLNFDIEIAKQRLRFISCLCASFYRRRMLILQLVLPTFVWAAGIVAIDDGDLQELRQAVLRAFGGRLPRDASSNVLQEILGWHCDPIFVSEWRALQTAIRYHARPRFGVNYLQFLPQTQRVLQSHGWNVGPDGSTICRIDAYGVQRRFFLGYDNPDILGNWLRNDHRIDLLQTCGRLKPQHRKAVPGEQVEFAQGLALPQPPAGQFCLFAGHLHGFEHAGIDKDLRHASLFCGLSVWFLTAGDRPKVDDPRRLCMCGKSWPSRPHLLWQCPHTADLRHTIQVPRHRAEERLGACCFQELPRPPEILDSSEKIETLGRMIRQAASTNLDTFFVATDGSVIDDVAAWSVFIPSSNSCVVAGVDSEDQTSFRAECEAIRFLLRALTGLCLNGFALPPLVVILCDCTAAIRMAVHGGGQMPLLGRELCSSRAALSLAGCKVELSWVPSHWKTAPHWKPFPGADADSQRRWNDSADLAAKEHARVLSHGSARATYVREVQVAKQWELQVQHLHVAATQRYRSFLQL